MIDFKIYVIQVGECLYFEDVDLNNALEVDKYIFTQSFSRAWKTDNPDEAYKKAADLGGKAVLFQVKELED